MELAGYVGTLNLLGDESRLRLCALLRDRELSVGDLVRVTGLAQSRVSTHLGRLREGGFVRDRRDGASTFYALADLPRTAGLVLEEAVATGDPTLDGDRRRLKALDEERSGALPAAFAGELERHYSPGRTWQSLALGLAALLDLGDVLDVGSADGAAASYVAPWCRSLTCIDTSATMIAAAKERLAAFPHARAEVADVHALPYATASFDAVLLLHTLTYAVDPAQAITESARVLRPGGRIVVLSLAEHAHHELTAAYGERRPGLAPASLDALFREAHLSVRFCEIACREPKKPHFEVVLGVAQKDTDR